MNIKKRALITIYSLYSISMMTYAMPADIVLTHALEKGEVDLNCTITPAEFKNMPQSQIKTTTPWTPAGKIMTFEGVRIKDILMKCGVNGKVLKMHALDGFATDIPWKDVDEYNFLIANKMNGNELNTRNFGPYFVVYPLDEYKTELNNPLYMSRFIWQVDSILVQ